MASYYRYCLHTQYRWYEAHRLIDSYSDRWHRRWRDDDVTGAPAAPQLIHQLVRRGSSDWPGAFTLVHCRFQNTGWRPDFRMCCHSLNKWAGKWEMPMNLSQRHINILRLLCLCLFSHLWWIISIISIMLNLCYCLSMFYLQDKHLREFRGQDLSLDRF